MDHGREDGTGAEPQERKPALARLIIDELEKVEKRIGMLVHSREPRLTYISLYLIGAGGKRIRPAVALLVFKACGGEDPSDMIDVAVALELIHSASLLHDDIIDGGEIRRGQASAFTKYGLADTLVAGDFLFSKAFALCGRFEEKIVDWAAEACVSLTEGEVMQSRFRRNPAVTVGDYLEIISRKTASLFSQGARVGAYLAGASPEIVEVMARCGFHIGMAFQVTDDLLDVIGSPQTTGKPTGIDLRDGNPSFPVVLAMERDEDIKRVFQTTGPSSHEIAGVLARIKNSGVMETARRWAKAYADGALRHLEILAPSSYKEALAQLIHRLADRGA